MYLCRIAPVTLLMDFNILVFMFQVMTSTPIGEPRVQMPNHHGPGRFVYTPHPKTGQLLYISEINDTESSQKVNKKVREQATKTPTRSSTPQVITSTPTIRVRKLQIQVHVYNVHISFLALPSVIDISLSNIAVYHSGCLSLILLEKHNFFIIIAFNFFLSVWKFDLFTRISISVIVKIKLFAFSWLIPIYTELYFFKFQAVKHLHYLKCQNRTKFLTASIL